MSARSAAPSASLPGSQREETRGARASRLSLGAALVGMATLHFLVPGPFVRLIPGWLGDKRRWVFASGVWELISGGLLINRRTKRIGGYAAAATIAAVFPGNIKMAFDAGAPTTIGACAAWARLPLQLPLFAWAYSQTR